MAGPDFLPELRGRIDRGVDVATQTRLRAGEGICDGGEEDVAHHQHIHVAVAASLYVGCDSSWTKRTRAEPRAES